MNILEPLNKSMWSFPDYLPTLFSYHFLKDAPIVLSDSEEEEMVILEPDKKTKKIR